MRRLLSGLPALLLCLTATLGHALPYTGSLSLRLVELPPLVLPASGTGESEGLGAAVRLTGGPGIAGTLFVGDLGNAARPIETVRVEAGISRASFLPGAGPGGGLGAISEPLSGSLRLGLFGPPPIAFLTFPLSAVGAEGARITSESSLDIRVTALGHGWTTGAAKFIGTDFPVTGLTLASATGADLRTAGGLGSVVLVAPTVVRTNIAGSQSLPLIAHLELTFVPEPASLALLGLGLCGLTAMGGRRRSAR